MADNHDPLLSADQIQEPDDVVRLLAEQREPGIRDDIKAAFAALTALAAGAGLTQLYGSQNRYGILIAINTDQYAVNLQPALDRIDETLRLMAQAQAEALGYSYDPSAAGEAQRAAAFRGQVLDQFRDSLIRTANGIIDRAIADRMTAEQFARAMEDAIALAPAQAQAVINYRALLEDGDRAALTRQMRDTRFDRAIRQAMTGSPLDQDQIDRMVGAYAERYRTARAATIAGDTAMNAANRGARAAYQQAVQQGLINGSSARRFWLTAGDERVCPFCRTVPLLNEHGVGLDEPYRTINGGTIDGPQAHAHCRCTERFEAEPLIGSNYRRAAE